MNHFLDSPDCIRNGKIPINYSLFDFLNSPLKKKKFKISNRKKKDSESAYSSTTIEDNCEVSFENGNFQK